MNEKDPVSVNVFDEIQSLCRDYRKQLKKGNQRQIEDYLNQVDQSAQANLFQNLLFLDIQFRQQAGEPVSSDDYTARFPKFKRLIRQAFFEDTMMSMDPMQDTPVVDSANFANPNDQSFDSLAHQQAAYAPMEMPAARRIGEYELIRELGRGGMGVVYEAKHLQRQNHVALKTLPTGVDGQEVNAERLHKFRNEFRSLSEINHPNLVGMQSLEVDGNQWFFTMDLINGVDFRSWVRPDDQLDEQRLTQTLIQLVEGITALHRRGIVHRDLKPSNVLVESDGRVAILDFGLVAEMQRVNDLTQTRSAMFAGTPKYAAPEQMYGQRSEASDWYALGVMIYEALTGKAPFDGAAPMEMMRQKQQEDPPKLSEIDGVSEDLASLTDGLLKREPPERLTTAAIAEILNIDSDTHAHGSTATDGSHGSSGSPGDEVASAQFEDEEFVLIGREEQLAQLEVARQELLQTHQPVVVWITGLSGEGKSSLAEKFLRPFRDGTEMLVLSGRCYDRESVPFKAIDSIIDPLVRYLRSVPDNEIDSVIPDDIEMLAVLFPLLNRVRSIAQRTSGQMLPIDSKQIRYRGFEALRELLALIGRIHPIAMMIDDLQWGDADSATALLTLLFGNDPPPVLFLGAYRRDEMDESSFYRQWIQAENEKATSMVQHEISLQPLDQDQCIELVKSRIGMTKDVAEDVVNKLIENTRGNPYFLEQIIEGFKAGATDWRPLPLSEIIVQKLGRLPGGSERLLEYVAIAGRATQTEELAEVSGSNMSVLSLLTHMRSERLVRLVGSGEGQLVDTWHDKIRETILDRMDDEARRAMHLKFAQFIESREGLNADAVESYLNQPFTTHAAPDFSTARVYDLAYHFQLAGDRRALCYQFLAGELAFQSYASEEAIEYLERARDLFGGEESERWKARLWHRLGTSSHRVMDFDKAIEQFESGRPYAEQGLERAFFFAGIATVNQTRSDYESTVKYHDLALQEIGKKRPEGWSAYPMSMFSFLKLAYLPESWLRGKSQRTTAEQRLEQSIYVEFNQYLFDLYIPTIAEFAPIMRMGTLAYRSDSSGFAAGVGLLASIMGISGFPRLGKKHAFRALAKINEQTDPETEGVCRFSAATALSYSADFKEADTEFAKSMPLLVKCGSHFHSAIVLHMWRHLQESFGKAGVEVDTAGKLVELADSSGNKRGLCWGSYDLASALARIGDIANSLVEIENAHNIWKDLRFNLMTPIYFGYRSFVLLQASQYETAGKWADESWQKAFKNLRVMDVCLRGLPWYLECVAGPNWATHALTIDRKLVRKRCRWARFLALLHFKIRPHLLRSRGRAFTALGNVKKGIRNFEKAVDSARSLGMKYDLGKSLLDLAAVKEDNRDENRAEAIRLLKEMESVIPRAESWLMGDQYDEDVVAPEFDINAWNNQYDHLEELSDRLAD